MMIVDMPLPKGCYFCPMSATYPTDWYCMAHDDSKSIDGCAPMDKRPSWCPIKGELVTCGECRYPLKKETPVGTVKYDCVLKKGWYDADHYCGYGERHGERKDGEHEAAI